MTLDLRTLALVFMLILPFMLAGSWWWLGWLMPLLPEKPRHARWAEWLTCAALLLILTSGATLAVVMRGQPEHALSIFSFRLFILVSVGFRFDWAALSFFVLLTLLFLWAQWAALMDTVGNGLRAVPEGNGLRAVPEGSQTDAVRLRVHTLLLLGLGVMGWTLFASDVVMQVLLWHLATVPLFYALRQQRRTLDARRAQKKWLRAVCAAGVPFLAGALVLCSSTKAADPVMLRPALIATSSGILLLGGVLMLIGLYVKLGLMPLHQWTFGVLRTSPLRERILLMAALPTLDLYVFMRLYLGLYPPWGYQEMSAPLTAFGLLALIWSAVGVWSVKTAEEWVEVLHGSQSALILLGAGVFALSAIHGTLLHVFVRLVALMALCGLTFRSPDFSRYHKTPFLYKAASVVVAAALVGVPGTAGGLGAGHIFLGLWQLPGSGAKLLMLLVIAAVLFPVVLLLRPLFTAPPRQRTTRRAREAAPSVNVPVLLPWVIASVVLLLLGVWTDPLGNLAQLLEKALRIRLHF